MVHIVDEKMGCGKSTAIINMINGSDDSVKFLFVTPYLKEVERVIQSCPSKEFRQPIDNDTFSRGKLRGLKILLSSGHNIATTHALFHYFDDEVLKFIGLNNYVLILDEVADVIRLYLKDSLKTRTQGITRSDLDNVIETYATVDDDTGFVDWIDDSYDGVFNQYKIDCELHSLALYGSEKYPLWVFPYKIFKSFKECYILTYMFDAQIQKYYFDMAKLEYDFKGVCKKDGEYCLCEKTVGNRSVDYRKLIHVCENNRLNDIGRRKNDLSKAWFTKNKNTELMSQLKNNIYNFFRNVCGAKSSQCIWTTFKQYRSTLKGKGYSRGFLSCNLRATNEYRDRDCVAYTMNRYMNPIIKNFFSRQKIEVNEDRYALSEMLQFIWRSSIRDGKEIWVYVPSKRMRNLLKKWIEDNSPER